MSNPRIVAKSFVALTLLLLILSATTWDPFFRRHAGAGEGVEDPVMKVTEVEGGGECDVFAGEWVPNPEAPYYTNATCWAIHEHQNCMKYGRPDEGFMKWRWQPDGCDLPVFEPYRFLDMVRNKSLAFVGDSVGRNHMQSLICLLSRVYVGPNLVIRYNPSYKIINTEYITSHPAHYIFRVEYPLDVSTSKDENFKRWKYVTFNFTIATFWSPFLVRAKETDSDGPTHTGLYNLYLDEVNEEWTTQIERFDYVIISAGHWFYRPSMYFKNGKRVGCRYCLIENVTDMPMSYGYRMAFKTAFKAINNLKNYKGVTFLRTFAPSHFEGGEWNDGGTCPRHLPLKKNETLLDGTNLEMYLAQMEEFKVAQKEGKMKGLKYRLLDMTYAMLLRPDGHPSRYGHLPRDNMTLYNDCVHWCLPGLIDSWSDFLLHVIKME